MAKNPKYSEKPKKGKSANFVENPINYQTKHIAWRFARIDEDSNWGLRSLSNVLSCQIEYDTISKVMDSNLSHPSFYDILTEIGEKQQEFDGIHHFIRILNAGTKGPIEPLELNLVCLSLSFDFFYSQLIDHLKRIETLTWKQIETETHDDGKSKSHLIDVGDLENEAKSRIRALGLEDYESIFSLRLNNKLRIFGIREDNILHILWVDRDHTVVKVDK